MGSSVRYFLFELCKKVGCGCMGGIRFSKNNNALVLFIKDNSPYDNKWEGEVLHFMGSGKGDQSADTRTNQRLAMSQENDTAVCLFERIGMENCRYMGRMVLAGKPYYEYREGKDGKERKVFFLLKRAD